MKWTAIAIALGTSLVGTTGCGLSSWMNDGVVRELHEEPDGERAKKVMLLTLPSGKALPVNYLREGDTVYAAADFPWWRELEGGGGAGTVLIRGETLSGQVRAVTDDEELRSSVFERLRPNALSFAGTLIVVDLDDSTPTSQRPPTEETRP